MKTVALIVLSVGLVVMAGCHIHEDSTSTSTKLTATPLPVKRYGMVTGLKPEKVEEYKKLHASAWPGVLKQIAACNIHNYSIYLQEIDGKPYLFSYFEYTGNDFDGDMKKMAADSLTRLWWQQTDPTQISLPAAAARKEIWTGMEEVFHTD